MWIKSLSMQVEWSNYVRFRKILWIVAVFQNMWCGCSWPLVHFSCTSSCSIMCCHVSLHSSSSRALAVEILYYCHTSMCMHTHRNTLTHVRARVHTLCKLLQKSHVLQEPWRGGGEMYDKLWHFHFSYKRYNCPQSVKMCCIHVSDQKLRFMTEITSNIP